MLNIRNNNENEVKNILNALIESIMDYHNGKAFNLNELNKHQDIIKRYVASGAKHAPKQQPDKEGSFKILPPNEYNTTKDLQCALIRLKSIKNPSEWTEPAKKYLNTMKQDRLKHHHRYQIIEGFVTPDLTFIPKAGERESYYPTIKKMTAKYKEKVKQVMNNPEELGRTWTTINPIIIYSEIFTNQFNFKESTYRLLYQA